MHTPLLVGFLLCIAVISVCIAVFFAAARAQPRQGREQLLFALSCLAFAGMAACQAGAHWSAHVWPSWRDIWLDGMAVCALAGLPPVVHFTLLLTKTRISRRQMIALYGVHAVGIALALGGGFWEPNRGSRRVAVLGFEVDHLRIDLSIAGEIYVVLVLALAIVVSGRLLQRYREDRNIIRVAPLWGIALLMATVAHDAATAAGLIESIPLMSFGLFALCFDMLATLVSGYGAVATALEQRTDELHERSRQLEASMNDLQEAQQQLVKREQLAVVGELAAVVAHEVRNPLAIITNAVASLRRGKLEDSERIVLVGIIEEEMARLEKLAGHLLDYARPVVPHPSRIDLSELLQRALSLVEERHGLNRAVEIEDDLPELAGDPDLLRQAFENVVANAVQAIGDAGELRVRVARRTHNGLDGVAVDFQDTGEGMSEQARQQALSPFFTTRPTGTGLGLPIVGRIIEAHGGTVEIDSRPGEGTTVTLLLPVNAGSYLRESGTRKRISLMP